MIDPILFQKCNNNKQRKLANIRAKNALNKTYLEMKVDGRIQDFKIVGIKIVNKVQSCAIQILPFTPVKEIDVNVGFTSNS